MHPDHRSRLLDAGVPAEILDSVPLVPLDPDLLPAWWSEGGNAFYIRDGVVVPPRVLADLVLIPYSGALIVVASDVRHLSSLLVGGDDALVFLGPHSVFTSADLYCGGDSAIVLLGRTVATRCAIVDARNGGTVFAEEDQLWAADVYVATDDMHRLEDVATGVRLNPYGGTIRLGRHVWLCKDAIVTGDVEIGEGSVIGARSMVRNQKVPARVAVAGVPARVIREGVTWSGDDRP
ncbi:MAG: hypothetical protein QM572_16550 [Nocardioides sp.]|uniref:acyltransferase n=1 Tax=Nocardioides sp. TaxID=35761 RepID=UPI0039E37E0E